MIRQFKVEDIEQIVKVWLESNLDAHPFVKSSYWISNATSVKEQLLQAEIYVFVEGTIILGFVGMQEDYLAGIFVDKASRSLGIGKLLLDSIKDIREKIFLKVYKENSRAVNFYVREGFSVISENLDDVTDSVEYKMQWQAPSVSN